MDIEYKNYFRCDKLDKIVYNLLSNTANIRLKNKKPLQYHKLTIAGNFFQLV